MKGELRYMPAVLEVREVDGQSVIAGYAAVFNQFSEEMWGFREQIAPGAFTDSIGMDDIRCLWNHNSDAPLGRNRSATLLLREDDKGLWIECKPPKTTWGLDALESIRRGDVSGMSFGFMLRNPGDSQWTRDADGKDVRTIVRCQVFDVSPCTYPAYPSTEVAIRALRPDDGPPESYIAHATAQRAMDGAKVADELRMYEFRLKGACL